MSIHDYSCILGNIQSPQALCRPRGCFLRLRKYSVARQSTHSCRSKHRVARQDALSNRSITNLGQEWPFSDWNKYSIARQSARFSRSKHSVGRRDAFSNCGKTLTAVRVLNPPASSILSAVTMLPPFAQVLCLPSEYFFLNKSKIVPQRNN